MRVPASAGGCAMVDRRRVLKIGGAGLVAVPVATLSGAGWLAAQRPAELRAAVLPSPPIDGTVDVLHGVSVPDPFRPLENAADPRVQAWALAHDARARASLDRLPGRAGVRDLLERLHSKPGPGAPIVAGGRSFRLVPVKTGMRYALTVVDGPGNEPRLLVDPNALAADGTVRIDRVAPDRAGKRVAVVFSEAGSDRQWIEVIDTARGRTGERLDWCRAATIVWLPDDRGFYYTRLPENTAPTEWDRISHLVYRHWVGQPQTADAAVFGALPHEALRLFISAGAGGVLVITGYIGSSERSGFWVAPLATAEPVRAVVPVGRFGFRLVGSQGLAHFALTDLDAPNWRLVRFDRARPAPADWRTVVPAGRFPMDRAIVVGNRVVVRTAEHVSHRISIFDMEGALVAEVPLPPLVRVEMTREVPGPGTVLLAVDDHRTPQRVERLDVATGRTTVMRPARPWEGRDDVMVEQVFPESADGTRVPMTLIYRRGLERNRQNRTLLTGYGGFGVSLWPSYNPMALAWVLSGGVWAGANIRGGGEYGQAWHDGGRLANKQRSFDDFIAAARWLDADGIAAPERIGTFGASNGGLLVLATMLQRPELFGAVAAVVPLADMLRFHRFTVGAYWKGEYGDPAEAEQFRTLLAYSPLHNIEKGRGYPSLLVLTADNDDRVPPAHAYKLVARLGADSPQSEVLLKTEAGAGHGAGNTRGTAIDRQLDVISFLSARLGGPPPGR